MFRLVRRHRNRTRDHEIAVHENAIVVGNRAADEVRIQVRGGDNYYALKMSRDDALALSALLQKVVDATRTTDGWISVD